MKSSTMRNTIPLSQTTKFVVDNRGKTAPTASTGIALIATNCVSNENLYPSYDKLRFVSQETYDKWFRAHPLPGDILLTNKGSQNGAVCLVPDPVDFVIAQDMVALRADEEVVDPLFLFAALRSPGVQAQIKNLDVSGIIPHFKKTDFDKLFLPYPSRQLQQTIGYMYFTLSDKIELNRRMNRTLEAIARSIFKSWFIDFDPVHAKAEGRDPVGMAPETAALFPYSFQDSPLGMIPKGWEAVRLAELLALSRESIKPQEYPTEEFDHYSIPAYDAGGPASEIGAGIRSSKYLVSSTSVLISKLNPRIPRVWLPSVSEKRRSVCSTEFLVCTQQKGIPREYVYSLLSSSAFLDDFTQMVTGTTGSHQRVRPTAFTAMHAVRPSPELLVAFTHIAKPLFARCASAAEESRDLVRTRDTLLPRLLVGEILERPTEQQRSCDE